jgi:hypothetical protein
MGYPPDEHGIEGERAEIWEYAEDHNANAAIIDHLIEKYPLNFCLTFSSNTNYWRCTLRSREFNPVMVEHESRLVAVCLAAPKICGFEIKLLLERKHEPVS